MGRKLIYFCKRCKIFERWGLRRNCLNLRKQPLPETAPPQHCEFLATRLETPLLEKNYFLNSHKHIDLSHHE